MRVREELGDVRRGGYFGTSPIFSRPVAAE